jgi:hypothetical protein
MACLRRRNSVAAPARLKGALFDGDPTSIRYRLLRRFQLSELIVCIELSLVFYFCLRPAVDPDYGWHIANGRHVLDGATLMGRDIYSWTASGLWVAHEWLTELCMTVIDRVAGPSGNSVTAALIGLLVFAIVALTLLRRVGIRATASALPLCFVGAMQSLAVRPLMLELLYLAALIFAIDSNLRGGLTRSQFLVGVATGAVVWANTHGSFLLLPVVLAITAVELLAGGDRRWKEFVAASVVVVIAFIANPWTVHLYTFALQSFTSTTTLARIQEWQRPNLLGSSALPILIQITIAAIGVAVSLAVAVSRGSSSVDGTRFVGLFRTAAFGVLALRSGRHIMLFGIAGALMIAVGMNFLIGRFSPKQMANRVTPTNDYADALVGRGAINVVAGLLVAIAVTVAGWTVVSPRAQERALASRYPVGVVSELRRSLIPGVKMLNEYRWGGFLIERNLLPVFIDGRSELYGDRQLERYASIVHMGPGWRQSIDSLGITLVLMPRNDSLVLHLRSAGWATLAEDSVGSLLSRNPH